MELIENIKQWFEARSQQTEQHLRAELTERIASLKEELKQTAGAMQAMEQQVQALQALRERAEQRERELAQELRVREVEAYLSSPAIKARLIGKSREVVRELLLSASKEEEARLKKVVESFPALREEPMLTGGVSSEDVADDSEVARLMKKYDTIFNAKQNGGA